MQILNVAQTYFPYLAEGGRPFKVRILSRKLAERGHRVTVLTVNLGSSEWQSSGVKPEKTPYGLRMSEGHVQAFYLPTLLRYRAVTLNPGVVRFCRGRLREFDVVHFFGLYDLLGPAVSRLCRLRRVPYVIEPMGMYRPIDRSLRLKRIWHRTVGVAFLEGATRFIATSELEQQELLGAGIPRDKVVIRYNGIDLNANATPSLRGSFRAKWGIGHDEPVVLLLSRLIPRKGADLLIEAFAQACPDTGRLVIAGPEGEAGYVASLKKTAERYGVQARVVFPGPLYDREKQAVFADADIFALPSRYENFANAPAEAMACGIPVIVTDSCGISSLVNGRAGLVIAPRTDELIDALRRLLRDRGLYESMRDGCRGVVAELSWESVAEQMEKHYEAALGGSKKELKDVASQSAVY